MTTTVDGLFNKQTKPVSGQIAQLVKCQLLRLMLCDKRVQGYTVYLLVNTTLSITLYRQLEDQQVAPPTIFISGANNSFNKGLCPAGAIS